MSKDANSFGHDKALAWESRGFVYTKKRMHRFDTPSLIYALGDVNRYTRENLYVYAGRMLSALPPLCHSAPRR